jgi:hypothetical protein
VGGTGEAVTVALGKGVAVGRAVTVGVAGTPPSERGETGLSGVTLGRGVAIDRGAEVRVTTLCMAAGVGLLTNTGGRAGDT